MNNASSSLLTHITQSHMLPCRISQLFLRFSSNPHLSNKNYFYNFRNMSKTALVVVANGSEEMETVTPIDTLRRAEVEVTVAGIADKNTITLSRGVFLVPEKSLAEATASTTYDAIILPGGLKGAEIFVQSEALGAVLKEQEKGGRLIAAICAAPTALKQYGIYLGKPITSHPTVKDKMTEGNLYDYKDERVVVAGNLITSRGPGTALEWSLAITEHLLGKDKADTLAKNMLLKQ